MTALDLLGLVAATLSTGSFVPQVVRLWRTRNAEGISLLTFAALAGGVSLWLAYCLGAVVTMIKACGKVQNTSPMTMPIGP